VQLHLHIAVLIGFTTPNSEYSIRIVGIVASFMLQVPGSKINNPRSKIQDQKLQDCPVGHAYAWCSRVQVPGKLIKHIVPPPHMFPSRQGRGVNPHTPTLPYLDTCKLCVLCDSVVKKLVTFFQQTLDFSSLLVIFPHVSTQLARVLTVHSGSVSLSSSTIGRYRGQLLSRDHQLLHGEGGKSV
ncbi:MAG: hypothetical protein ACC669_02960, partial [bacterium]